MERRPLRGALALHRLHPTHQRHLVAPSLPQGEPGLLRPHGSLRPVALRTGSGDHDHRVHKLHRPGRKPLRRIRRHLHSRLHSGKTPDQHRHHGHRVSARLVHRHHGRGPHLDQAPTSGQRAARQKGPHHHILHLLGGQHRRQLDPARRPAPLSGLPPGGGLLLDLPAYATLGLRRPHSACRLLRLGYRRLPPGGASARAGWGERALWHRGQDQLSVSPRHPLLRPLIQERPPGFSPLPLCRGYFPGRRHVRNGGPKPLDYPEAHTRGERIYLVPCQGGGHPLRCHLRRHDADPPAAADPRSGARGDQAVAVLLGHGHPFKLSR